MADPRRVRGLALELGEPPQRLRELAAEALGVPQEVVVEVRPVKVSLDARGPRPKRIYAVDVWLAGDEVPPEDLPRLEPPTGMRPLVHGEAPIIVGTGPAGLWAALRFVQAGRPAILLERGEAVEARSRTSAGLRRRGELNPESNLCFGEGGAGTYSDGKLYTRIKDGRVRRVYRELVAFGADPSLLVDAHPHVGTNRLVPLIERMRAWLLAAGCEIRFGARVVDLLRGPASEVRGVRLHDGTELPSPAVLLATGHSARGVYRMLARHGVPLEPKAFAIGARVEHPQELIDRIQYGRHAGHPELEAAAYAVKAKVGSRGVYSFCMCPGGFVIPTTTEHGRLNVNGMSNSNRGSRWANSALVVTVEPGDFWLERPGDLEPGVGEGGPDVLPAGIALQRALEARAFEAGGGGYRAPAQRLTSFVDPRGPVDPIPERTSYRPGITGADLRTVLPPRFCDALSRAVQRFERQLPGFLTREAVLVGVETTTSSPVRIPREVDSLMVPGLPGLLPAGEGAGWAGGIVSSAVDGIRCAEAALEAL